MGDILIFGSEGFIGSNLIKFYLKKGLQVVGIDRMDNPSQNYKYYKFLSISDVPELLLTGKFKSIVNAAGSGNVGYSVKHPLGDFESNCYETAKILDAIRITGVNSNYLHISSAAVYGNPESLPVREESPANPLSPYGWHKLLSEILCKEYFALYGVRSCIMRPFSIYGPGLKKQLFWDIYKKAIYSPVIELFGTGLESRDFIYIDDLVRVVDILLKNSEMKAECYNVANGSEILIKEAAKLFIENFPTGKSIYFNGHVRTGDPLTWKADISKIEKMGFKQETSIHEGLRQTYLWIKNFEDSQN